MNQSDDQMKQQKPPERRAVSLTPRGVALCTFAFRDGPAIGLSDEAAMEAAKRLIDKWDGSETLLQIYQRTELWPIEIAKEER